ncbi:MAG: PduL/EutD family phosphate acyltransferase [Candidatus Hodarchaeota archaeon]
MVEEHSLKSTGLRGVEVSDTNLCLIEGDQGNLFYRGYSIQDLAEHSTYEEIVYLLIYGQLPTTAQLEELNLVLASNREIPQEVIEHLHQTPKNTPTMNVLQSSLALLAGFDPEITDESKESHRRMAIRIIAKIPTVVAAWERIKKNEKPFAPNKNLSHAANFLYMLKGEEPAKDIARCFDVALILHAEHSFNASTFTARVIASTGADLYAAISGAIGSLSGKYHGGASPRVMMNLLEIKEMSNVEEWVKKQFDAGTRIMGMGHAVYETIDPRAKILREMAKALIKGKNEFSQWIYDTTNKMVTITQEEFRKRKGREIFPNVDLYGASVYTSMDIPMELFTPIFTMSRSAGWAAHVLEEKFPEAPSAKPVLYRPSADYIGRYCGPLGCEYIPLTQREAHLEDITLVERFVTQELQRVFKDRLVPVVLSRRHVHLSQSDFLRLFGLDSELKQTKTPPCGLTVELVGSRRSIKGVCVLKPFKEQTQVEISLSDGHVLGINPPIRHSGNLSGTPGIHIIGPKGAIQINKGVIRAARHIHMSPDDAKKFGVIDKQKVAVSFPGKRAGILDEIMVRIHPLHQLELHLDIDEGNALALNDGDLGHIIVDLNQRFFSPFR